jgi:hypothetical protein
MYCIRDSAGKKIYFILKIKTLTLQLKNKPVIALTGTTGFLGSHLMAAIAFKRI